MRADKLKKGDKILFDGIKLTVKKIIKYDWTVKVAFKEDHVDKIFIGFEEIKKLEK